MRESIKISLITVTTVMLLAVVGDSIYMIEYSLRYPYSTNVPYKDRFAHVINDSPEIRPWVDNLARGNLVHDTLIMMQDGEQHHATFVYASQSTRKTAVVLHGYHDSRTDMMQIAHIYARMGYNVLLPDHHTHGWGEGEMIQMRWKERHGVLRRVAIADSLLSDSTGHSEQMVYSVSMGTVLTMCVSGGDTPDYVKCFVKGCGYTNVWDEFKNELKTQFGLPPFPLFYTASALNKLLYGWLFGEAPPLRQVARCRKLTLFIHENRNTYVRASMVYPLYKAKS